MGLETFDPSKIAYVNGPTPPSLPLEESPITYSGKAEIIEYLPSKITINTDTNKQSVLILNDASLPQWQTLIDNQPAPQYIANTIFKAAIVPAGEHQVTFTYHSPAIKKAQLLTIIGLITSLVVLIISHLLPIRNSNSET